MSNPKDKSFVFLAYWQLYCRTIGYAALPFAPVAEYQFAAPVRRWRFDWAFPEQMVAVEVEGGVWAKGRHVRGKGYEEDCAKYNLAAAMGWRVFRYTPGQLADDPAYHLGLLLTVLQGGVYRVAGKELVANIPV